MIFEKSRYEHRPLEQFRDAEGNVHRGIRPPSYYPTLFAAKRYIVQEGDHLDEIALEAYRDERMWWIIAAANPELLYPGDLPVGMVLRIPDAASVR